jgi:hypothetical protein
MDQGRAEACRITLGQTNLVRVSKTVLAMLRAQACLKLVFTCSKDLVKLVFWQGKRSRPVTLHAIRPETMTAYRDRLSACLANGRSPGRKIQVASRGTGVALKANVSL